MAKFCEQVIDDLVGAFAAGADVKTACKVAGVSKVTYHEWLKDLSKTNFSDRIAQAQSEFRRRCPDELVRLSRQRLADALQPERRSSRRVTGTSTTRHYDEKGDLTGWSITEQERIFDEQLPIPMWAIDRVLPKAPLSFEELAAVASKYGCRLEVVDQDAYRAAVTGIETDSDAEANSDGLSEQTAAAIRAQIMGFPEPEN